MQAAPVEYTWAIMITALTGSGEEAEAHSRGANRDWSEVTPHPGEGPGGPTQSGHRPAPAPQPTPPPPQLPPTPKPRPARVCMGVQAAHSAQCPWCPYRRAAERGARRAGCGPGRLRRGEQQQVGVAGTRSGRCRASGGRRGAGVLRRGDDDDLRGVEQPQRAGPEQGLQRRRAWAARGGPGHGHGAHGPGGPGGRRRRRRGPMAADRGEGLIPLRIPLRPRPPLPAKSRPLLRAKSFLPRKSHEPPSSVTIGCPVCDGGDGDSGHWVQRAGPAVKGGMGRRCE